MKSFTVNSNDAENRLDKFITKLCPSLPQGLLYKSIRKKRIKVNGKKAELSYKVKEGDLIELYINDEFFADITADTAFMKAVPKLNIIYEDDNIIVVNKPAGLVVHEDEGEKINTLISYILKYLYDKGEYNPSIENTFAPALCNRIDRNTAGLVIAAKNAPTLRVINQKIKNREIKKFYKCIVKGIPKEKSAVEKAFLLKDEQKKQVKIFPYPVKDGKTIITAYKVIKTQSDKSLLEIDLLTGRTHQIRAHMAYLGYPLLGDTKYGNSFFNAKYKKNHQVLLAYKIIFDFVDECEHLNYLKGKTIEINSNFDILN